MTNVVDIGLEREKRKRCVITGSRRPVQNRVRQVLDRAHEIAALRRGDTVETPEGRGTILAFHTERDEAMVSINGDHHAFACDTLSLATPEHVA
jgi:hypothetical protein